MLPGRRQLTGCVSGWPTHNAQFHNMTAQLSGLNSQIDKPESSIPATRIQPQIVDGFWIALQ
jgi:outer membrane murein-binding lipoprotein Lpp